jgi:hypothetical protein
MYPTFPIQPPPAIARPVNGFELWSHLIQRRAELLAAIARNNDADGDEDDNIYWVKAGMAIDRKLKKELESIDQSLDNICSI